jgi:ganglioside-induced differentiation-associated protein 1
MVKLYTKDIKTKEVTEWKGLHLFHFSSSSCSQKARIVLNLKGVDWVSHPINLLKAENYSEWYLGINPRGLLPALIHDGDVHIESNDIVSYLDDRFETPKLIPAQQRESVLEQLNAENDLHLDLRTLTFGFSLPKFLVGKPHEALDTLASSEGTVEGKKDSHKQVQLAFWRDLAKQGITPEQATYSVERFKRKFTSLEAQLADQGFLLGDRISIIDIVWFIYAHRLKSTGYPFKRLHPGLEAWYQTLLSRPEIAKEVADPLTLKVIRFMTQTYQAITNTTLEKVTGI